MATDEVGVIYTLHFTKPLGDTTRPRMSASHYVGWSPSTNVQDRIADHRAGRGAAITKAAVERGIHLVVVNAVRGTRSEERARKDAGNHQRHCWICAVVEAARQTQPTMTGSFR